MPACIELRPRRQRPHPDWCQRISTASARRRGRRDGDDRWISPGLRQRGSWGRPLGHVAAPGKTSNPTDQPRSRSCGNRPRNPTTAMPVLALGRKGGSPSGCRTETRGKIRNRNSQAAQPWGDIDQALAAPPPGQPQAPGSLHTGHQRRAATQLTEHDRARHDA